MKYPILQIDPETGRVLEGFGSNHFILPHGLSIEKKGNGEPVSLWVTDLALHQVMKFDWGNWKKPSMVLGRRGIPGENKRSFCQPADVAVASSVSLVSACVSSDLSQLFLVEFK